MLIIKRFWKIAIVTVVSLNILHIYYFDALSVEMVVLTQKNRGQFFSKCDCRKNDHIFVKKQISSDTSDLYEVFSTFANLNYTVKETELDELVCGVYETLRTSMRQFFECPISCRPAAQKLNKNWTFC